MGDHKGSPLHGRPQGFAPTWATTRVRPYIFNNVMKTNPKDILSIGLFVLLSLFVGYLSLNFVLAVIDKWA